MNSIQQAVGQFVNQRERKAVIFGTLIYATTPTGAAALTAGAVAGIALWALEPPRQAFDQMIFNDTNNRTFSCIVTHIFTLGFAATSSQVAQLASIYLTDDN